MAHDVIVVGGGPGGYAVAFRAAARGLDVGLVEEAEVGGTCLHRGCIPSKAVLHVAEVLEEVQRAESIGLAVSFDGLLGDRLAAFRQGVIDPMHRGLEGLVRKRCTLYEGRGRVLAKGLVEVTDVDGHTEVLDAPHVVLATGSVARGLPGIDIDGEVVQTSDHALWFTEAPTRAVIIGAGAIGMEFASMWRPMGTEVTVVEALDRVLPLEDADSSRAVARAYRRKGIDVLTGARVEAVDVADGRATVLVGLEDGERERTIEDVDVVLVAVGRGPNTADTGAQELGVLDDRGFVEVDEWGQTSKPGIWAVGDVVATLALAHAAFAEGFVVGDRIAMSLGRDLGDDAPLAPVDHVQTPRVTYCHPEVASVGLTEAEARDRLGDERVATSTYSLAANAKASMLGATGGHAKVVHEVGADGTQGETLGVHLVGPMATDLIGEATMAVSWGALPREVAAITHAHPSLYEAIGEAFLAAAGTPFHGH